MLPLRTSGPAALAALVLVGCAAPHGVDRSDVAALLERQRGAWNRGDLATFVGYYHPEMTFLGSSGLTRKPADLLEHYRRSYPDAAARGVLSFDILEVRPAGADQALVLGSYRIDRAAPDSGYFTLLVVRGADGGLRVLHDHTSRARAK
ncbi:MAG: nuclear transport factor 2 family protein [Planctomycetes bacterium]|nr:nuclear transport factor 2 family protein [Planctomycetota bacterium]MCB9870861.1 nuclear transport factor 2 family protein [Planctomycetota bacterium]